VTRGERERSAWNGGGLLGAVLQRIIDADRPAGFIADHSSQDAVERSLLRRNIVIP
jgi:hypothetical protein